MTARQAALASQEVLLKYVDKYRSDNDTKALADEGYQIDYDKLVGVGTNCAVFLAHPINPSVQPPPVDKATGQRPIYTPGYDIAVKIIRRSPSDSDPAVPTAAEAAAAAAAVATSQNRRTADVSGSSQSKRAQQAKNNLKIRTGNLKLALALGQTKQETNILRVIDVFKTSERVFIFTQYCAYGSIISFIRRNGQVPSKLVQKWSSQIASAMCFLHKYHIAHRNYKLENVLIDEKLNAKLTGFGLSKLCIDFSTRQVVLSRSICGSEPYLAPEMLRDAAERAYDPRQADVWAFGVGFFLLATRKYPFEAENLRSLRKEQLTTKYLEKDTRKRIREPMKELLRWCFVIDPNSRPSMSDIVINSTYLNAKKLQQAPAPTSPATEALTAQSIAQAVDPSFMDNVPAPHMPPLASQVHHQTAAQQHQHQQQNSGRSSSPRSEFSTINAKAKRSQL